MNSGCCFTTEKLTVGLAGALKLMPVYLWSNIPKTKTVQTILLCLFRQVLVKVYRRWVSDRLPTSRMPTVVAAAAAVEVCSDLSASRPGPSPPGLAWPGLCSVLSSLIRGLATPKNFSFKFASSQRVAEPAVFDLAGSIPGLSLSGLQLARSAGAYSAPQTSYSWI